MRAGVLGDRVHLEAKYHRDRGGEVIWLKENLEIPELEGVMKLAPSQAGPVLARV